MSSHPKLCPFTVTTLPPEVGPFPRTIEWIDGESKEYASLRVLDNKPTVTAKPYPNKSPLGDLQTTLVAEFHVFDSQAEPVSIDMNFRIWNLAAKTYKIDQGMGNRLKDVPPFTFDEGP